MCDNGARACILFASMNSTLSIRRNCLLGAFLGDTLAMPVHWYYDREALSRDYGRVTGLVAPKNPHSDSILWRSTYEPINAKGDILHEHAIYWGRHGVHYHQFLRAGENTLNMQLALELLASLRDRGSYERADYLQRYIAFMTTQGRHHDTYIEECHRNFFTKYARGKNPETCGAEDIHIGGLAHVPILAVWYCDDESKALSSVHSHVRVTHSGELVESAARDLTKVLLSILHGTPVRKAIEQHCTGWVGRKKLASWSARPDEEVIGRIMSPACYLQDAFPAALYLAWKYADNLQEALIANTNLGGDNCHRGIVVGSILGAGGLPIPEDWRKGLLCETALAGL
jgi:ADP-ribosyl-[dinitrogen reductase] hydrolase